MALPLLISTLDAFLLQQKACGAMRKNLIKNEHPGRRILEQLYFTIRYAHKKIYSQQGSFGDLKLEDI